jgi:hypothetical protein
LLVYIMGNVQCGAPAYDEYEVPLDPKLSPRSSRVVPGIFQATKDAFLNVHLEDQSLKCILEPKEVKNAHGTSWSLYGERD